MCTLASKLEKIYEYVQSRNILVGKEALYSMKNCLVFDMGEFLCLVLLVKVQTSLSLVDVEVLLSVARVPGVFDHLPRMRSS
jgi:hypothetical protein